MDFNDPGMLECVLCGMPLTGAEAKASRQGPVCSDTTGCTSRQETIDKHMGSSITNVADMLERRDKAVKSLLEHLAHLSREQQFIVLTSHLSIKELEELAELTQELRDAIFGISVKVHSKILRRLLAGRKL